MVGLPDGARRRHRRAGALRPRAVEAVAAGAGRGAVRGQAQHAARRLAFRRRQARSRIGWSGCGAGCKGAVEVRPTSARWAWIEYLLAMGGIEAGRRALQAHRGGGSFAAWKRAFADRGAERTPAARRSVAAPAGAAFGPAKLLRAVSAATPARTSRVGVAPRPRSATAEPRAEHPRLSQRRIRCAQRCWPCSSRSPPPPVAATPSTTSVRRSAAPAGCPATTTRSVAGTAATGVASDLLVVAVAVNG